MPESIAPAFVKIEYASANAPHVALIPTLAWNDPEDGSDGTFDTHSGSVVGADGMINDLVDAIAVGYTSGLVFSNYTIFTQASPSADPVPRYSALLTQVGLTTSTSWQKAVQVTMTWRTVTNGIFKIVLLDAISSNNFDKATALTGGSVQLAVNGEVTDLAEGWAGRDGGRPATFLQRSITLNEKLRRQYHMN